MGVLSSQWYSHPERKRSQNGRFGLLSIIVRIRRSETGAGIGDVRDGHGVVGSNDQVVPGEAFELILAELREEKELGHAIRANRARLDSRYHMRRMSPASDIRQTSFGVFDRLSRVLIVVEADHAAVEAGCVV